MRACRATRPAASRPSCLRQPSHAPSQRGRRPGPARLRRRAYWSRPASTPGRKTKASRVSAAQARALFRACVAGGVGVRWHVVGRRRCAALPTLGERCCHQAGCALRSEQRWLEAHCGACPLPYHACTPEGPSGDPGSRKPTAARPLVANGQHTPTPPPPPTLTPPCLLWTSPGAGGPTRSSAGPRSAPRYRCSTPPAQRRPAGPAGARRAGTRAEPAGRAPVGGQALVSGRVHEPRQRLLGWQAAQLAWPHQAPPERLGPAGCSWRARASQGASCRRGTSAATQGELLRACAGPPQAHLLHLPRIPQAGHHPRVNIQLAQKGGHRRQRRGAVASQRRGQPARCRDAGKGRKGEQRWQGEQR